jgi:flagellar motor switch protein FliG
MAQPDNVSGAQRAAAFLLTLDREEAANVLKHLDENVIVEVVEAMGQLDPALTRHEAIGDLQREFIRALARPPGARVRSDRELRQMLETTLGKSTAGSLFDKIRSRLVHERPFIALESAETAQIARALGSESDGVCALVIAHLEPQIAADLLGTFAPERALEIVKRMATLVPPGFETLSAIARDLEQRLQELAADPVAPDPAVRLKSVAEILNFSRAEVESKVLAGLGETNDAMVAEIREFMFTWEDLSKVDRRGMQKILASIDTKTLAVSLKACSAAVEANIMANLSARVREMVKDERQLAGALPMAEVQNSRAEVMKAVRALMESGEFRPARAGEDLVS